MANIPTSSKTGFQQDPEEEPPGTSGGSTECTSIVSAVDRPTVVEIASHSSNNHDDWREKETHELPQNNFKIVFPGLILAVFLAALDQSIIAVALPTIIKDIGGQSSYSWVGTAYLLTSAGSTPIYGIFATIVGRMPLLMFAIATFLFGSAICGAAQSFLWLTIARAIQGIGGGGVLQMINVVIADITSLEERGKYLGLVSAAWCIASVTGPLIGGILTDHASWRWCFWINLPTGGVAAVIIFFVLNLSPQQREPLRTVLRNFDFIGLFLIITSVIGILLGLQFAQESWRSPQTIVTLTLGGGLFVLGCFNESYTKKIPIMPPKLFRTRTTAAILVTAFLHSIAYTSADFYIPFYFQVLGASATSAGLKLLPYLFGSSFVCILAALVVERTGKYRPSIWFGWIATTVGFGVMISLNEKSNVAQQLVAISIAGIGTGTLFQPLNIGLLSAMPIKDMPTTMGAFILIRTLGGTVGLSIGNTIISDFLRRSLPRISGYSLPEGSPLTNDISGLSKIMPVDVKFQVLRAYSQSVRAIWIVMTATSFAGLCISLLIRSYSLKRNVVQAGDEKRSCDSSILPPQEPKEKVDPV